MRFEGFSFGSIRIDGVTYEHDVVIDRGKVRKRNKKASKKYRDRFGHTPLSIDEEIPWNCRRLVIGTGSGHSRSWKKLRRKQSAAMSNSSRCRRPRRWGSLKQTRRKRTRSCT